MHTLLAFEGTATVVEPKGSWFDPALCVCSIFVLPISADLPPNRSLFAYLVFGAMLYGLGTLIYSSYVAPKIAPASSKRTKRAPATPVKSTTEEPSTVVNGVDSDWIPAHHVKARKGYTSATSGDESEGGKKKKRGGRK